MNKNVRSILDELDRELVGKGPHALTVDERRSLWDVLSALRGPDAGGDEALDKSAVTVPVRRKAFPRLARVADRGHYNATGAAFASLYGRDDCAKRRAALGAEPWFHHFQGHGQAAFKALGLVW